MKSLLLKAAKLKGIATSESNLLIVYLRDDSGWQGRLRKTGDDLGRL